MKKVNLLLILALLLTLSFGIASSVSAWEYGCTPGYWKQDQHFDSWMGYSPGDYYDEVFCWEGVCYGPHISLLDALSAKNKDFGSGEEAAMIRHSVAALLNTQALAPWNWEASDVFRKVAHAYKFGDFGYFHGAFEEANENYCPLN